MLIKRSIASIYHHNFSIAKAGLAAIFISARCRSKRQTNSRSDEDLRVEIDHAPLRGRPLARRTNLFNTPSAFNGSQMQGLQKTVVFLTVLSAGEHVISLAPKTSAFIEEIDIRELSGEQSVSFSIENRAEDGDRRPWYTFVVVDLPLQSMSVEATINRRRRDSDDIKLIINGESRKQNQSVLHRFWLWAGSLLRATKQGTVRERYVLQTNLPVGVHYVEFYADRTPILHAVSFALNETESNAEARARAIIVRYTPLIKAAAREFEVEPAMVGVVIYQEQSTNVNFIDTLTDYLGGVLHLNTSIGVGQVRVETAQALEEHYPNLHPHSPDGSFQKSTLLHVELLKDPLMNIRYVAAKIKFSQERWNLAGLADSERAGILGTLYNLEDVANPITPHPQPELNEFGQGAAKNYPLVKQWLVP